MPPVSDILSTLTPPQAVRRLKSLIHSVTGGGSSITAIDLDGDFLHLVQASRRLGRTAVTRLAVERLEPAGAGTPPSAQSQGAAIAQCLRQWRIRPDRVVMAIPRSSVILRSLTLPQAGSPAEMAAMVYYQVSKDLPFRLEEAVIDFKAQPALPPAISSNGNGALGENQPSPPSGPAAPAQVSVLVAIIKKEVLKYHQELAKAARLPLAALGLRSYANARCVEACSMGSLDSCVALATLHPGEVVVDMVLGHELVFSRMAILPSPGQRGGEDSPQADPPADAPREGLTAPDEALSTPSTGSLLEETAIEVVRSFHCYEGLENHGQVTRLHLAGTHPQLETLSEVLHQRLGLPAAVLDPVQALRLNPPENTRASGAIAVIGLAYGLLDPGGLPFNFLHPKRPAPPGTGRHTRVLAITAALSVLLCLLVGLRMHLIRQRTQARAAVQQQVSSASQNLPLYRQTIAQARTVKSWLADEKQWLDHLAYLCALLPPSPDLYVTSLSTGSKGSIHLAVKARHSEVITRLDTRLREAGYEMRPPAITPSGDAYGYPFQATLEITASDKLQIDLAKLQFISRPEDDGSMDPAGPGKTRKGAGRLRPSDTPSRKGGAR